MSVSDQEAEELERRWRRGYIEMLVVFLLLLGFWAGISLLTQHGPQPVTHAVTHGAAG